MKKRVVVGMSGGVDSSVAACILLEKGYEVIGATMQIWQDESVDAIQAQNGCCGLSAVDDARRVADCLGIPYYVLNFKAEFRKSVMDYFVSEYGRGRTPNPCIACNRFVKWGSMLNRARQIGADCIATGHYARISRHMGTGRLCVCRSSALAKDQSYALYGLSQGQLAATLLPLADFRKEEVRAMAAEHNLPVAQKPDSQDICFVPDGDYARFIEEYSGTVPARGFFVDETGCVLGEHNGIIHYTVGQRKGLGISFGKAMYVKRVSAGDNTVVLAEDTRVSEMAVSGINWMAFEPFGGTRRLSVKIRYNHKAVGCEARVVGAAGAEMVCCRFDEPQRAVSPGQAAVFYDGGCIAFGGAIEA